MPFVLPSPRSALAISFLLVGLCCSAQDLRYFSEQSWSTEEGLPQNSVHSIVQTHDGYLWIATESGLARFDGSSFQVFDRKSDPAFHSNDICCLAESNTALWIGTSDGLLRLHNGQFQRIEGLPSQAILSILAPPNSPLLVETTAGWARYDGKRFQPVPPPSESISQNAHGLSRIWQTPTELPRGRIATAIVDREGLTWIGMNNGLFVANAIDNSVTPVAALRRNSILSILQDAEGNHWIGTETSGLHILRRLAFRSEPSLTGTAVASVTETSDHTLWIGTRDDGLRRLHAGIFDQPLADNALTSPVTLCLAPAAANGLWVGTPDGLNYITADNANRPHVQRITSADGLPDDYIRSLAAAPDDSVWVGTRHGLAHLQHSGGTIKVTTLTTADGLGGDLIGAMLLTPNRDLWVSTSGGLSLIHRDGKITNFTTADGLASPIVTALAQDTADHLYAATDDGTLSLFDGHRFHSIKTPDLGTSAENKIEAIVADPSGSLWLRMDRGIRRVSATTLNACLATSQCNLKDDSLATYGLADGLPNDELVAGASSGAWLTTNGDIWFPSRGGVAIVDTQHLPINALAPPVVLERLLIDDVPQPLNASLLQIPFAHSRLTMEYAALSFVAPSEVRYRFILEGFDRHWTDAGNRRSATYTNLPPGTYTFRVQAMNNDGLWNRAGASIQLRIVPPFYRRWWFITLIAVAACLVLAGLYLLRLRRLQAQFDAVLAERNRMAREIHDTLTQDFVGTSLQLDILHQHLKGGHVEKAIDQVRQTRQLVTDGLEEARRSIWELRANNSQDSLPTRMTRLLQRDTFATIAPKLHCSGAYRELDPRTERELLRITQEALSNVLRHAHATETFVDLLYATDHLTLIIRDNGIGFSIDDASRKEGHFGLIGMQERAFAIDGKLDIVSQPGSGTTITLGLPLQAV